MKVETMYFKDPNYTIFFVKTPIDTTDIHHLKKYYLMPAAREISQELSRHKNTLFTFLDMPDQTPWETFWIQYNEYMRVTIGTDPGSVAKYVIVDVCVRGKHSVEGFLP
jgi:hypothetical protein